MPLTHQRGHPDTDIPARYLRAELGIYRLLWVQLGEKKLHVATVPLHRLGRVIPLIAKVIRVTSKQIPCFPHFVLWCMKENIVHHPKALLPLRIHSI